MLPRRQYRALATVSEIRHAEGPSGLWPDGSLALRAQFDGRQLRDGSENLSQFDAPEVRLGRRLTGNSPEL
jgi:hypothetical protein